MYESAVRQNPAIVNGRQVRASIVEQLSGVRPLLGVDECDCREDNSDGSTFSWLIFGGDGGGSEVDRWLDLPIADERP
jgi:hypothetical protein